VIHPKVLARKRVLKRLIGTQNRVLSAFSMSSESRREWMETV
jgi:hypothetical protein